MRMLTFRWRRVTIVGKLNFINHLHSKILEEKFGLNGIKNIFIIKILIFVNLQNQKKMFYEASMEIKNHGNLYRVLKERF